MKKVIVLLQFVMLAAIDIVKSQDIPHPYDGRSSANPGQVAAENVFLALLIVSILIFSAVAVIKYRKSS